MADSFLTIIDRAIHEEWVETINAAVELYHGHETRDEQRDKNVIAQLAFYLTKHEMDYNKNGTAAIDEVDDILLARMYHFLMWQSHEFDIWAK